MTLAETNWEAISQLDGLDLQQAVFDLLQQASVEIQENEIDDPTLLSVVPRLADLVRAREELRGHGESLASLARAVGLWNYIDRAAAGTRELLIAEAVTVPELGGITLHREQIAALNVLLAGKNLILSAPTSFGKSVLVDALLLSGKYKRVAIVLPTIALLDEFRRRLVARFGAMFDVLMHHSDVPQKDRLVFLGTQERLINRKDLGHLDLVVVDEFYKLDPARRDDRSVTLNAAVYQLLRKSSQFFFLGPNIQNVQFSADTRWRFEFLRTRFSTVAVDTYDLQRVTNKKARLLEEAYRTDNWPVLIFASSPDKANEIATEFVQTDQVIGDGSELASWIDANYGGKWELSAAVGAGIGIHHGRIPRALASRFVKLFNDGKLPILICTSTLIEGVNTAAKSVLIYDKTIMRENYDFFTFSNIRGRAGRLGQHHVGKVFLFNAPPGHEEIDVSPPLFGDLDSAPDELLIHLDEEDSTAGISGRLDELRNQLGLSSEELRQLSSLGVEVVSGIKQATESALRRPNLLGWTGRPNYYQIGAVCGVICRVKQARDFGVYSPKQLTLYLYRLRRSNTFRSFFDWHASTYRGDLARLDNVFRFLRACEFSLPELFTAVEIFVRKAGRRANYSLFAAEMPRWFRAEALKNLEEQGVPIQIAERFLQTSDTAGSLGGRLRRLALAGDKRLSAAEVTWILDALPA